MEREQLSIKDYKISWQSFHQDCRALAWRIDSLGKKFKGIVPVTRGGLIPAGILGRELDIFFYDSLCIRTYDAQTQNSKAEILKKPADFVEDGEGWIVVDDLVDTGNTFNEIRKYLPKAHYTSVYVKPDGVKPVDTFIIQVSQDTWVFFPWEWEELKAPVGSLSTHR